MPPFIPVQSKICRKRSEIPKPQSKREPDLGQSCVVAFPQSNSGPAFSSKRVRMDQSIWTNADEKLRSFPKFRRPDKKSHWVRIAALLIGIHLSSGDPT